MVLRILFILFLSCTASVCYLAGYTRLMSGILVFFGALVSFFFGLLFTMSPESRALWLPVYQNGNSWPFYLLSVLLCLLSLALVLSKKKKVSIVSFSKFHFQNFVSGMLAQIVFLFLASYFWFPSAEKRAQLSPSDLSMYINGGTLLYLLGVVVSLIFLYRASLAGIAGRPDMVRRLILACFAFFQCDKIPALVAYLLIYSSDAGMIFPTAAFLALAAYIPLAVFFYLVGGKTDLVSETI